MSVLLDSNSRILIQGLGNEGQNHLQRSLDYGTTFVAGVHPSFKSGDTFLNIPVFDTAEEAVARTHPNVSIIFVPAPGAADAIVENLTAEIPLVICITEGLPVHDMITVKSALARSPSRLLGPNCPGVITPAAHCRVGIMPARVFTPGRVGVISRSGTLVYESVDQLTALGIGQSTCVGVGGDPIIGTSQVDVLEMFNNDPATDAVVLIGEIGGTAEQASADYIRRHMQKPVVAFIAGATAPPGRRMGHAGAIIEGKSGTAAAKIAALQDAGATISRSPATIGQTMDRVLRENGLPK